MPDAPLLTISDPNHPGEPGDVLAAGSERAPFRVPRKVVVLGAAVALLGAGGYAGVTAYQDHQREVRAKAAAFAKADAVHVTMTMFEDGAYALDPTQAYETFGPDGTPAEPRALPTAGRVVVPVSVDDDGQGGLTSLTGLTMTSLVSDGDLTALDGRVPGSTTTAELNATVDCGPVAAGRYPDLGDVVLVATPESGRAHRIRLRITSRQTPKALALDACGLPDPDAVPTATFQVQGGQLQVDVSPVTHAATGLQVLSLTSPGFVLTPGGGFGRRPLPKGVGVVFPVSVRVVDCAAARAGDLSLTLQLRGGSTSYTVRAVDAVGNGDGAQPGSSALRAAITRSC